jgi:hypothetical protein
VFALYHRPRIQLAVALGLNMIFDVRSFHANLEIENLLQRKGIQVINEEPLQI